MFNGINSDISASQLGYGSAATGSFDRNEWWRPFMQEKILINDSWIGPRAYVDILKAREKTFSPRRLKKEGGRYKMRDRSGREVDIGVVNVKDKTIVDPRPTDPFDRFFCMYDDGSGNCKPISLTYKEYVKKDLSAHKGKFSFSEDCPFTYFTEAFFRELTEGDDIRFLQLPKKPGWNFIDGDHVVFASTKTVIPELSDVYNTDILRRQLPETEKLFADCCESVTEVMPGGWRFKLLLCICICSILNELLPTECHHLIAIDSGNVKNRRIAESILWNRDFEPAPLPVTSTPSQIECEIGSTKDSVVLFSDKAYDEDFKKRDAGLNTIVKAMEYRKHTGNLYVLLTDNPGALSEEAPIITLTLSGTIEDVDFKKLHASIMELISSLIDLICRSYPGMELIRKAYRDTSYVNDLPLDLEENESARLILTAMELLHDYGIVSDSERKNIITFLSNIRYNSNDPSTSITNDFRNTLSECITAGKLDVARQYGPPFFDPEKPMAFIDGEYINLTKSTLEHKILPKMRTTHKRKRLLTELKAAGLLYATKHNKRTIDVDISGGISIYINVYSFPLTMLSSECRRKLSQIKYASNLIAPHEQPDGYIPLISTASSDRSAGVRVPQDTSEPDLINACGKTRSGKTHFQVHQALHRSDAGHKVIIFDQAGSFSASELAKHIPQELAGHRFTHWEIGELGLPVDLLSLENCKTLPDQKKRLFSVLSVAGHITGGVQGKVLRKQLPKIIGGIKDGSVTALQDTLRYFDENDAEQAEIRDRLEECFTELEGLESSARNWKEFLDSSDKIVVISTASDGIRKSPVFIDMLLASLYEEKQHHRNDRYTIILDEIEDLCLDHDAPLSLILRKGAKHGFSMLLASQEYSVEKDRLGKLIGNCGTQVFFRPKDANLSAIAKHIGFDAADLVSLGQGECVVWGLLYDTVRQKNAHALLAGQTYNYA